MLEELRQRLRSLERPPGLADGPAALPLGAGAVDRVLGGGLMRGALHEIAASGEAHVAAATGFVAGVAALSSPSPRSNNAVIAGRSRSERTRNPATDTERASGSRVRPFGPPRNDRFCVWIAEDMAALESGALHGSGLDGFGVAPERLVTVAVAQRRDLPWAMEEALRCHAVACVVGEMRHGALDAVAVRRLSLAAAETGALALILRAAPGDDASTAATRWIVGASPASTVIPGRERSERTRNPETKELASGFRVRPSGPPRNDEENVPRFAVALVRNRRGPRGQWILEWSDSDGRFSCAAHAQPVALPPRHRPHHQNARSVA